MQHCIYWCYLDRRVDAFIHENLFRNAKIATHLWYTLVWLQRGCQLNKVSEKSFWASKNELNEYFQEKISLYTVSTLMS